MALQWSWEFLLRNLRLIPPRYHICPTVCVILMCKVGPYPRVLYFKEICLGELHLRGETGSSYWKTSIWTLQGISKAHLFDQAYMSEYEGNVWRRQTMVTKTERLKQNMETGGGQRRETCSKSSVCVYISIQRHTDSASTSMFLSLYQPRSKETKMRHENRWLQGDIIITTTILLWLTSK